MSLCNRMIWGISAMVLMRCISAMVLMRCISAMVLIRAVSSVVLIRGISAMVLMRAWVQCQCATEFGRVLVATALNAPQQCVSGWSWPALLRYWLGASMFGSMDRARSVRWLGEFRGRVWDRSQGMCRVVPSRDFAGYQVKKRRTPAQQVFPTSFINYYY
jgi:hypothetical protein